MIFFDIVLVNNTGFWLLLICNYEEISLSVFFWSSRHFFLKQQQTLHSK